MSWPWKKKTSVKAAAEKVTAILESAGATPASTRPQADRDKCRKPNYVQISLESYSHLTGLENQVKTYEEQVQALENQMIELNEKLSAAQSEVITKGNLVKQHSKVAEEAVSGWEKAEAETLALKNSLESVTLDKLTAEDRASHLDGALKECMRQIRNLKGEHEKNLQEMVLFKTKQWEKVKHEYEARIGDLDQALLGSTAENAALSRSLQEQSNMLIKISEEKTEAEAEIELLKSNIEACKREINSLNYELHVVAKELEIRNEEKNMSVRSAEVANNQHMEGAKKIAKLEAECQRLRSLVRKKLPGPAALAQMKLEVENLGQDHGDANEKRASIKPPCSRIPSSSDYSFDNYQKFHKENEFLTERLLAVEEETKMLKEALAKRNSELQASRTMCAEITSKLQNLEAHLQISNQNSFKSSVRLSAEASLSHHNAKNPLSSTSMSEDGNDDERSCAESWPSASVSELSQSNKEKKINKLKADNANNLELMYDFVEMEKLACLSSDLNGSTSSPDSSTIKRPDSLNNDASAGKDLALQEISTSSTVKLPLADLESRISAIFKSISKEGNMDKALEDIKQAVLVACDSSQERQVGIISVSEENSGQGCPDKAATLEKDLKLSEHAGRAKEANQTMTPDLEAAIIRIHDFVLLLGKEAVGIHNISVDREQLHQKIELFSVTHKKVISSDVSLFDFTLKLSHVLAKVSDLRLSILGCKCRESIVYSPDYIDKVALPENNKGFQQDPTTESYQNGHASSLDLTFHPEVSDDGTLESSDETNVNQHTVCLEDYEKMRSENDRMAAQLARSTEDSEATKSQLQETKQMLAEVKSQLTLSQKSYDLAETQLKCMAESYRSLEMRAQELETEVKLLQTKLDSLDYELQEEKGAHQDALNRSKDLQDQLERIESCTQESDADLRSKQQAESAAAAAKLSECQQTILLLGKQLNALRPPNTEIMGSPKSEKGRKAEGPSENPSSTSGMTSQRYFASPVHSDRTGAESPLDLYSYPGSPSETQLGLPGSVPDTKRSKHWPTLSGSSTSCSTPAKQLRGFSRFSSSKGKKSSAH